MEATEPTEHFDILIVGAGLSGIGAAYHLQHKCPARSFVILEGRERSGGTWDLFRYPGIRSDSDMFTMGYSFKPWNEPKAIADGSNILNYIRETAAENGIDNKIRFRHRVKRASWSTGEACWSVEAERTFGDGVTEIVRFTCNFLFMCSGYYRYEEGYTPEFPGRERFQGPDRASASMARTSRLRGKARGGDRLGRDRGDAGAGDGEDREPRHHAAAISRLTWSRARPRISLRSSCGAISEKKSPIRRYAGATCCSACISSSLQDASPSG